LRYSACPPHRPSRLHLGCQIHQTWCAPGHLGAPVACSTRPIQNFLPGTMVAIVGVIWRMALPGRGLEPNATAVRCGRAGCEDEGRLRCASK
jgi:hypothetical protein